ncbi:MAG TPA: zinc metallopeptidase, partial [Bacteroidales bacterium]|nr:zinc metallopeptidase [Bacteroidales bacterium]
LSEPVFNMNSVAAAAVAAHETGHAIQHARAYAPLKMRSALVPAVSFSSKWVTWILLGGIIMMESYPMLIWVGIALFAMTTLFSFVTLPVEINASQRALVWLKTAGVTNSRNHSEAQDALKWAAYTYVVAALGSLATLIYYVMIAMGNRR